MSSVAWPRTLRVWEWTCRVIDVTDDQLWAEIVPRPGTPGTTVQGSFDKSLFSARLVNGDVFTMTSTFTKADAGAEEQRADTVALVAVRPWTAEEIDAIRAEAKEQWTALQELVDEPRTSGA